MSPEDRQTYIDWLMLAYPLKAESYFNNMSDADLLKAYEEMNEIY